MKLVRNLFVVVVSFAVVAILGATAPWVWSHAQSKTFQKFVFNKSEERILQTWEPLTFSADFPAQALHAYDLASTTLEASTFVKDDPDGAAAVDPSLVQEVAIREGGETETVVDQVLPIIPVPAVVAVPVQRPRPHKVKVVHTKHAQECAPSKKSSLSACDERHGLFDFLFKWPKA